MATYSRMQKVLTVAEMREVDRLTTEEYGIPSILLMENAAHAVARVIREKLGGSVEGKSILILCGKGNNGGDGAALARILWTEGAYVVPLLFGQLSDTKGDARLNLEILRRIEEDVVTSGGVFNKLLLHQDDEDLIVLLESILNSSDLEVVVDALFGTGLIRELREPYSEAIQRLDNHRPEIIAIDIPSGLNADEGREIGPNIRATTTVTFTAPKLGNTIAPAANSNGQLIVANIGSPQELIDGQPSRVFLAEEWDAKQWLKATEFDHSSYKNKRGHTLLIAGSESYSGAAIMCGNAAIRSGVGLVTVGVPESCKVEIASRSLPEVIVRPIAENGNGDISDNAFAESEDLLRSVDAIAVGCGLSATDPGMEKLVRQIVEERRKPVIVDAGALWFYSPFARHVPPENQHALILTPHEGEFLRLLGTDDKDVLKDRVAAVREFAQKHNVILVLKGERVLIGEPGGKVVVNPTGNSGLGKAGNGDTLTGILAGFVTQAAVMNINIFETVVAAVYVAGMAGDVAEKKFGKRVMTASDVRECLSEVFQTLASEK